MRTLRCFFPVMLLVLGCRLYEPPRYARLDLPAGKPTLRVLMIGDSLTYYNDLPGLLQQLSAREKNPIYIEQITTPYTSLRFHWNLGQPQQRIDEGHWDHVILQEFSRRPVTDPDESMQYFRLFSHEIARSGGRPVIFENWTLRDHDNEYSALYSTYRKVQDQTHAIIAPIGTAWRACRSQRPDIELLVDDRHPTDAGTYLAACVLYDVLYQKKSSALPMNLEGPDLPATTIAALRRIADQTAAPQATTRE